MAWFKYFKSDQSISSATPNYSYSYPYCKRAISKFTPRDTLSAGFWLFANIKDLNINTYKSSTLETLEDANSYVVVYEKNITFTPVKTVINGDYIYFETAEEHTAGNEIQGSYFVYYATPNLRKLNEVDNAGTDDYQVNLAPVWEDIDLEPFIYGDSYSDGASAIGTVYSIPTGALPTGLSISSSTGQITGTVNSTGSYSFTVRATTDDGKYYNEASFSGTVYEYPEWVDSTLANIDYNTAYSDSVWADGYPAATYSISSGSLPSGITLNSTTGLVSGLTTSSGAYSFTIKAENAIGSITQSFSGTVQTPPSWSDETLGIITQGVSYSDGVSATGTATITYSVYSGSLPTGLSLNSSTGAITGTTGATGSYSFTIRATNTWGYVEKAFSGTIYQIPAWTDSTIANMIYGQAYSDAVAASGYPTVTYSVSSGALPSGITLNSSTGAISGTSTAAGSYSFTIKAENAAGNVTQSFSDSLFVTPAWTDNTLAAFTYNTAYSDQVVATGSPTYTVSSGSLPTGLSLNSSTGAVTGTPSYGAYSFTIQAANETGSVTQSFSGAINKVPEWTDQTLADGTYLVSYSDGVSASGYPSPTYSITSGSLPSGLSLNSSDGTLSGTPSTAGSSTFTITASNTEGDISKSFSVNINRTPAWSDSSLSTPVYNTSYSDGVSAIGYPTITYSLQSGSLPSGFSLNTSNGTVSGTYTTPVNDSYFSYSFTIRATNSVGYVDQAFTWNIDIPFTYSGGSSIYLGPGYTARYFTSNGTFQILTGKKNLEVAVISGGSGGGGGAHEGYGPVYSGGGGGAGGNINSTTISNATVGNYTISIGGAGSGGARGIIYDTTGVISGSQGGTGGTSTITKPDSSTITRSGSSGGNGGTSYGFYYYGPPYYAFGGSGANNVAYSGTSGSTVTYSQYAGGGGGAGSGGNASSIPNYYTGANGGAANYIFDSYYAYGEGGPGGNWSTRNSTSSSQAAGGAGGSGANDATYGPGYAGNGGIVLIRWST